MKEDKDGWMDRWMVDSIHECTKSEAFTGKKVFSSVCYNECKIFMVISTTYFSTRDDAASSSDILNVSLHVAVLIYTFLLPTDV